MCPAKYCGTVLTVAELEAAGVEERAPVGAAPASRRLQEGPLNRVAYPRPAHGRAGAVLLRRAL